MEMDRIVTKEMLVQLAAKLPESSEPGNKTGKFHSPLDVESWMADHGLFIRLKKPWNGGTVYVLEECPFDPQHNRGEARIIQFPNGALSFGCFHSSCQKHNWHALRDRLEAGWDDSVLEEEMRSGEEADDDDHPYFVRDGVINRRKFIQGGFIPVPLCNFDARIVGAKTVDDGAERKTVFTIDGLKSGRQLTQIQVAAERFSSMNWVTSEWGGEAIVYAGFGTKDHLRVAIQILSGEYEHLTVFGHLGWRKIWNRWYFLHGGGGISEDGLSKEILVELPVSNPAYSHMKNYVLPPPPKGVDIKKCIKGSLDLLNLAPKSIMYPLIAAIYRAPLSEIAFVDFSIFLVGETGSQKTELTVLAQAHYGDGFHAKSLPGNWSSTENVLEKQAFLLKDSILTIDDFVPRGTTSDVQRMHQKADRVLRAQGNLAGRGRMRPDGKFQPEYFPRGLICASGEDMPQGQSLRSRMLIVEVPKGSVDLEKLTKLQEDAANGLFAQSLSSYIQWLAPQIEELKKILPARQRELRTEARKFGAVHDKTPDIVASLALGWETFLQFAEESEAISADEADTLWKEVWEVLNKVAKSQSEQILSEEPTRRFLDLLAAAASSGMAHVADIDTNNFPYKGTPETLGWKERTIDKDGDTEWVSQGQRIGWLDRDDL